MTREDAEAELDALLAAWPLKHVDRAGWLRVGVPRPESVASHTWGLGVLVLWLLPPALDRARALTYALLHDLAEVVVGDLTPHDGVPPAEKARREAVAAEALLARRPDLLASWHAYEAQTDEEARFVRQLDRLDMALQAVLYARQVAPSELHDFLVSAARVVRHPTLRPLLVRAAARLGATLPP